MRRVESVAKHAVPVLIEGETGVGKELIAEEIHRLSAQPGQLVTVNCGAITDGIIQSELFGHTRGAFSGAGRERGGLVDAARGGTLFLDEIGDATPALQVSLLRLLEQRRYRPVGSDAEVSTDARFIAASHVDLAGAVTRGTFRQDLFGRLDRLVLRVPPLRERTEDAALLAMHFAREMSGRDVQIQRDLALALFRSDWPNNVRQLRAVIEQAVVEADGGDTLTLSETLRSRLAWQPDPSRTNPSSPTDTPRPPRPTPAVLEDALRSHACNVRAVARVYGVSRNTVYRWIEEGSIDLKALRAHE